MINSNKIKAKIIELGLNQKNVAEKPGIKPSGLSRKINDESGQKLTAKDVKALIEVLHIENPAEYFFTE